MMKTKKENMINIVLLLAFILWRIPFVNKGIDYMDTGFSLQNFKEVFSGHGIQNVSMFYTSFVGGCLYEVVPSHELLVLRIMHVFLTLGAFYFAYQVFKDKIPITPVLVCFLVLSLPYEGGEALFSYFMFSSLILMLDIWVLYAAMVNRDSKKYLLAGLIGGFNAFVRLPNLFFLSIILAAIAYNYLTGLPLKKMMHLLALFIVGVCAASLISLAIMCFVMGPEAILKSFLGYAQAALGMVDETVVNHLGIQEVSGHTLIAEIKTICRQGLAAVVLMGILYLPVIFALHIGRKKQYGWVYQGTIWLILLVASILLRTSLNSNIYSLFGAVTVLVALFALINFRRISAESVAVSLMCVLTSFFVMWGTDLGMQRFFVVRPLQALTLLLLIREWYQSDEKFFQDTAKICSDAMKVSLIIGAVAGLLVSIPRTFNDASFIELKYEVSEEIHPLRGMKTSELRAKELNEYYEIVNREEFQGKEFAIFGYFPLGFVIGDNPNYFSAIDPCVDWPRYSVEELLGVINEKEEAGVVPVIVLSKINMLQGSKTLTTEAKQAVIDYMLTLHDYEKVIDTEYYEFYAVE